MQLQGQSLGWSVPGWQVQQELEWQERLLRQRQVLEELTGREFVESLEQPGWPR